MKSLIVAAAVLTCCAAAHGGERKGADFSSLMLEGYYADRLESCKRGMLHGKDPCRLAVPFTRRFEDGEWGGIMWGGWQTEFWGKYMHSAVPMAVAAGDRAALDRIGESVKMLIATQDPDGYIGNYRADRRGDKFDVWGAKYTILGFLFWYDATGDKDALAAAGKLAGWVMDNYGEGRRSLLKDAPFCGLGNCSLLEPMVWLYRRTGERKYLDYAAWIVRQLDDPAGPEVFRFVREGVALKDCKSADSATKAYEKMSCCQGLVDYYLETGDRRCLETARAVAAQAAAEEIDITGAGTQHERFCGFAKLQTEPRAVASEMCVIITWMRLCEKLLKATGESRWADELEKSYYNAYLGGLSRDGETFQMYQSLAGIRSTMEFEQCSMRENCCNANGARGFLSFYGSALTASDDELDINQFVQGIASVPFAKAKGGKVSVEYHGYYSDIWGNYPKLPGGDLVLMMEGEAEFSLRVRSPIWADATEIETSWGEKRQSPGGGYVVFKRRFAAGDRLRVTFKGGVKAHRLNGHVAFTAGPIVLARDARFGDGDLSESVEVPKNLDFRLLRSSDANMQIVYTGYLKTGLAFDERARPVGFCDFASAGNTAGRDSFYRVWLPETK